MADKRSSGLFRKYFIVTISVILASFVFIGGALLLLVTSLWMNDKAEILKENTVSVSQNVSDVLESEILGSNSTSSVIVICNTLLQISNAIDADMFIVNTKGEVVYCKETLQANMNLFTGSCMVHNKYVIPENIMESSLHGLYSSTGDLGGMLDGLHFVVGSPVKASGKTIGTVFVTQPVIEGLMPYVAGIFLSLIHI